MSRHTPAEPAVTIEQVAKRCGVSKTTVSRYLNGKYEMLSDKTRSRIQEVVEELNYRPNRVAQSLKSQNRKLIGCVVSDIGNPFSAILVKGINSVCQDHDCQLLLSDSADDAQRERKGIADLLANQVDGLIVNTTGGNDAYLLKLKQSGIPLVLADRCLAEAGLIDTVATENYRSTYQCVSYLHELGYEKVGFFTFQQGQERVSPRVLRYQGFHDALRDGFDLQGEEFLFRFRQGDREDIMRQIDRFQSRYASQRLAAFAVNGVALLQLLQALRQEQIQIGPRFGVCGFDDWGWADLIPPGITTITQDSWLVGRTAAKLLFERIGGGGPEKTVHQELLNKLEIRGSTVRE